MEKRKNKINMTYFAWPKKENTPTKQALHSQIIKKKGGKRKDPFKEAPDLMVRTVCVCVSVCVCMCGIHTASYLLDVT